MSLDPLPLFFFFFNDTATTEIYTLSLHDALPISTVVTLALDPKTGTLSEVSAVSFLSPDSKLGPGAPRPTPGRNVDKDRKSTRLNSSHQIISYAVFCLKKKKHYHTTAHPSRHERT